MLNLTKSFLLFRKRFPNWQIIDLLKHFFIKGVSLAFMQVILFLFLYLWYLHLYISFGLLLL